MSADPPQILNTGIFSGAQNVIVIDGRFIEVNYQLLTSSDVDLPPLPPMKLSSTFFTGRNEYLGRLKTYFSSPVGGQRKSFLLHGLGGIGKTQICLKFVEQNADMFSDIFWIDASSESSVELGLMQIAQAYIPSAEMKHSARDALHWISQRTNWILVYDGADGHYSVVDKFLPPGNGGNILITSRNVGMKRMASKKDSMEVSCMMDEEAVSLLLESAMLNSSSDHINNLAGKLVSNLGGIPLAIDQAGAYMQSCNCNIDDYLELYIKCKEPLMSDTGFKGASDYGTSTYGTWDVSMQTIEHMAAKDKRHGLAAQSAIKLLRIFSFLDHTNIPEELFGNAAQNYIRRNIDEESKPGFPLSVKWLDFQTLFLNEEREWDHIQFLDGIQVLLSFSLIKSHNHLYSLHLMVHNWSRHRIPKTVTTDFCHTARALLSCSIVPDKDLDIYAFCKLLAPHIRSNSLYASELGLKNIYYADDYDSFTLVFHHIGSWIEMEKLLLVTVDQRKTRLGYDHHHTLISMGNLAYAYRNMGRLDEAEKLDKDVLNRIKSGLGSEHPDYYTTMGNLAVTYSDQGRWGEAEVVELEVMNAKKERLGSDHPETLKSMGNLASTYTSQGKWDDAEKLQVYVTNATRAKLGSGHPDTLRSMGNLASTYLNMGRWDEAESLAIDVMGVRKERLGPDHPETLISMGVLAMIYSNQGKWDEAEKLQVDAMNSTKAQLGPGHLDTLINMGNLASTYEIQGRWDEAERLQVDVINIAKAELGIDHPATLIGMGNLAMTYVGMGRWDEAENLQAEAMNAAKLKFGSDHPETLRSIGNLALIYSYQGKWDEAEKLEVEVVNAKKEKLGLDHLDTLRGINNLAMTYSRQGKWKEAEQLQIESMHTAKATLGSDHHDTLAIMENLGSTYWHQKRWNEAEELQAEVMNTTKLKLGLDHPDTLRSMGNLASTYSEQGRLDEAEKLEINVMNGKKAKLGSDHPDTLTSMGNLALTYCDQERWNESENLLVDVVNSRKVKLGPNHPDTLSGIASLAMIYQGQGKWDEAKSLLSETVKTMEQIMGLQHPITLHYQNKLESLFQPEETQNRQSPEMIPLLSHSQPDIEEIAQPRLNFRTQWFKNMWRKVGCCVADTS
ncbi:hypothetical protein F5887DRAFT_1088430 [Amanita rubescens]|nr:hypothetical protein F5887DRAFT_1088430 [Amanita rubescens]